MKFSHILGLGISACLLLIVWQSLAIIIAGLTVIFYYLLGVGSLILLYIGVMVWRQKETERLRSVDGQYALQRGRLADGTPVLIDMNKSISGITILHKHNGPVELPPAAGWQLQGEYVAKIQTTRSLAAITPGDAAMIKTGGAIQQPRLPANITKLLPGFGPDERRPSTPAPLPALPAPTAPSAPRLTIDDALARSTGERWITGQADSGELIVFEPGRHAHAAIVGVTGTGKTTSVGFTIALEALRAGWHVVILDPDGGANWQPFSPVAEWHETDRAIFPDQVAAVHRLYERRATINNPRPVLVIIEEYGDLIRQLRKSNRAEADQVDGMIDAILQRGRKRRVHLALIDQYPEHWSQAVIGGTKFRAVFQLGPNQGAKMEEYQAAKLPDVGRFLTRGLEYNSFHAESALPRILAQLPAPSTRRVITDRPTPSSSPASSLPSSPTEHPVRSGGSPTPYTITEPTEPPGPTDYQARAAAMIAANPATRQIDMIEELGIAKGYANELWHALHPAGKNYKPPTPPTAQPVETKRPATIPDALHGWREIVESDTPTG